MMEKDIQTERCKETLKGKGKGKKEDIFEFSFSK